MWFIFQVDEELDALISHIKLEEGNTEFWKRRFLGEGLNGDQEMPTDAVQSDTSSPKAASPSFCKVFRSFLLCNFNSSRHLCLKEVSIGFEYINPWASGSRGVLPLRGTHRLRSPVRPPSSIYLFQLIAINTSTKINQYTIISMSSLRLLRKTQVPHRLKIRPK